MICDTCYEQPHCAEQRGFCTMYRNRDVVILKAQRDVEEAMKFKGESSQPTKED